MPPAKQFIDRIPSVWLLAHDPCDRDAVECLSFVVIVPGARPGVGERLLSLVVVGSLKPAVTSYGTRARPEWMVNWQLKAGTLREVGSKLKIAIA
jgi:hypothetical protein